MLPIKTKSQTRRMIKQLFRMGISSVPKQWHITQAMALKVNTFNE